MNISMAAGRILEGRLLRQIGAPVVILMILAMLVLPLPAFLLDVLFTFNITLSIMVMLVAMNARKPLDFSVFPTVLLVTTLMRLALNVASTRLVLLEGHTGPDAAGKVIEAFGHFLVGGNMAVGFVVFAILVVINFVVITKGAGRIAEVGARFTLDAMPGKQMAIDADLNAGLIGEDDARKRRKEISQEADFYGAMDGASKFVRGDAIAGILILFINIIGGMVVGMIQHDMPFAAAGRQYVLLTVGDGLVSQIPALIISVAAGLVVSRVGDDQDVGEQVVGQMFNNPGVWYITAAIVGSLGMIPGMPNIAFLSLAGIASWAGYAAGKRKKLEAATVTKEPELKPETNEASWADVSPVDIIGLEVGYRLVPLVDKSQDGELLKRIRGLRKKFASDMGFLPAPVHVRDNLQLKPTGYRISIKGVEVGESEVSPGEFLAINPGRVAGPLDGRATKDPTFNLPAFWISPGLRDHAHALGYTVVDASTVVSTHVNHIVQTHAAELLGRQETQALLDHIAQESPKLVEDLVPKLLSLSALQRVLQNLITEEVSIRDMRTIVETLSEYAPRIQDPVDLTTHVRVALSRSITQSIFPGAGEMQVIALESAIERTLMQSLASSQVDSMGLEPGLAERVLRSTSRAAEHQQDIGLPAVLLVPAPLRWSLSKFLRKVVPDLKVLSNAEIPDHRTIRVVQVIGGGD